MLLRLCVLQQSRVGCFLGVCSAAAFERTGPTDAIWWIRFLCRRAYGGVDQSADRGEKEVGVQRLAIRSG